MNGLTAMKKKLTLSFVFLFLFVANSTFAADPEQAEAELHKFARQWDGTEMSLSKCFGVVIADLKFNISEMETFPKDALCGRLPCEKLRKDFLKRESILRLWENKLKYFSGFKADNMNGGAFDWAGKSSYNVGMVQQMNHKIKIGNKDKALEIRIKMRDSSNNCQKNVLFPTLAKLTANKIKPD